MTLLFFFIFLFLSQRILIENISISLSFIQEYVILRITSPKFVNNKVKFCIKSQGTVQSKRYEEYYNPTHRTCSLRSSL